MLSEISSAATECLADSLNLLGSYLAVTRSYTWKEKCRQWRRPWPLLCQDVEGDVQCSHRVRERANRHIRDAGGGDGGHGRECHVA